MTRHIPCPICGKPAGPEPIRPFCSQRCAQIDLGRWLTESYRIPVDAIEDDDPNHEAG